MPIFDTYTKRKRRRVQAPEPFQYDFLPPELRRQIVMIWLETIGPFIPVGRYDFHGEPPSNDRWRFIFKTMVKERGVFQLGNAKSDPCAQCQEFVLNAVTDDALEIIELSFRLIEHSLGRLSDYQRRQEGLQQAADDAIAELNGRFREHRVGYQYANGQIIRVDSQLLHAEATVPALTLLQEEGFQGPLDEFMRAHDHYRKGEIKDANVDALSAFESTIKAICDERRWAYAPGATASPLVQTILANGLVPQALPSQFEHLVKTLETGLPPIRNKMGGHGQGASVLAVEPHLGTYALHLLGATIVLLIEAHRTMK